MKDWYIQLGFTCFRGYWPSLDYVRTTFKTMDVDRIYCNVTEFNEDDIKFFQDNNVVHVLLYFTKLFFSQKFPIVEVSHTFNIQQTMTLY